MAGLVPNTNRDLIDPNLFAQNELDLLSLFYAYKAKKNKLTAREYLFAARDFLLWKGVKIASFKELELKDFEEYQLFLLEKYAPNTVSKKMAGLSSLCKFLAKHGHIDKDLLYGKEPVQKQNQREHKFLSEDEVAKIFSAIEKGKYHTEFVRAFFVLALSYGLRLHAIRSLKIGYLYEDRGIKMLRYEIKGKKYEGKKGKYGRHPITPAVATALYDHLQALAARGFDISDREQYLFPNLKARKNEAITDEGMRYHIKKTYRRAGIEHNSDDQILAAHALRASLVTEMHLRGEALEDLQTFFNHSSIDTTRGYVKESKNPAQSPAFRTRILDKAQLRTEA